ncbi:MAG: hypothetical protein ACTMHY_02450 [Leuconostoc mesenteroides]
MSMARRVLNWMLLSGQFGGEAQVIAYDNNQAKHVYEQVKNQAKASPLLSELSDNNQFKSTKTRVRNSDAEIASELGVDELVVYTGSKAIKPTLLVQDA